MSDHPSPSLHWWPALGVRLARHSRPAGAISGFPGIIAAGAHVEENDTTNHEIVLSAFDAVGDEVQHNVALIHAISRRQRINEVLAGQLVDLAIKDGLLRIDPLGMVRKV